MVLILCLWFRCLLDFSTWVTQALQIEYTQKCINDIFFSDTINFLFSLFSVKGSAVLPVPKLVAWACSLLPYFSSQFLFSITTSSWFCHLNSKLYITKPNIAYNTFHSLAIAYLHWFIFVTLSFWIFCAAHLKLFQCFEAPSHTLLCFWTFL